MTNTSIEKTPAELQLNEGPETYLDAGLTNNDTRRRPLDALRAGTVLPCPPWCANDCDTGEGIVHTALTGRHAGKFSVECGYDDVHATGSRRGFVFVEIERRDDELTPAEALALAEALMLAAERLGVKS